MSLVREVQAHIGDEFLVRERFYLKDGKRHPVMSIDHERSGKGVDVEITEDALRPDYFIQRCVGPAMRCLRDVIERVNRQ
jgi:hypothetical protein